MFGMGGTATELLGDRSFRILPVTDVDAAELVRSLRLSPLLFGYRGAPLADVDGTGGPAPPGRPPGRRRPRARRARRQPADRLVGWRRCRRRPPPRPPGSRRSPARPSPALIGRRLRPGPRPPARRVSRPASPTGSADRTWPVSSRDLRLAITAGQPPETASRMISLARSSWVTVRRTMPSWGSMAKVTRDGVCSGCSSRPPQVRTRRRGGSASTTVPPPSSPEPSGARATTGRADLPVRHRCGGPSRHR